MSEDRPAPTAAQARFVAAWCEVTKDMDDPWRVARTTEGLAFQRLLQKKGIFTEDEFFNEMSDVLDRVPFKMPAEQGK